MTSGRLSDRGAHRDPGLVTAVPQAEMASSRAGPRKRLARRCGGGYSNAGSRPGSSRWQQRISCQTRV